MSLDQFALRAKKAGENAVAANLRAGIPVTGYTGGRIQTIAPGERQALRLIGKTHDSDASSS